MNRTLLAFSLLLAATFPAQAQHMELYVFDDGVWAPAVVQNDDFDRGVAWPLPMVTRSVAVPRAIVTEGGIRLRFFASDGFVSLTGVNITAVPHAFDEQVLLVDGAAAIVGPPTLVTGDPAVARLDMAFGPRFRESVRAPAGKALLGINSMQSVRSATSLSSGNILKRSFDQIFAATVRALTGTGVPNPAVPVHFSDANLVDVLEREVYPLSYPSTLPHGSVRMAKEVAYPLSLDADNYVGRVIGRGRCLELWIDEPRLEDAEAWTLLVSITTLANDGDYSIPAPWSEIPAGAKTEKPPLFDDASSLLDGGFTHLEGPAEQLDIRPTMGPGAAWGDVDGDGYIDLYLAQGGGREELAAAEIEQPVARLFRFLPAEGALMDRFESVAPSGLEVPSFGMGPLLFDADGDGDLDLYQANFGEDTFFENRWLEERPALSAPFRRIASDGFPVEVTGGWSAGVAAGDVDLDGDLDLYVTTYLVYDESQMPDDGEGSLYSREDPAAMLPFSFPGGANYLLLNDSGEKRLGDKNSSAIQFRDGTEEYGLADEEGRGMQPVFWDFDRDGDMDLYVANDVSMNRLWRNETIVASKPSESSKPSDGVKTKEMTRDTMPGPGGFKDVSFSTGMDDPRGGMGVAVGDYDQDGDEDLFLSNWQLDANALYRNNLLSHRSQKSRVATFQDVIVQSRLAPYGVGYTSWGAELFDADCDTDLDLFVPNGYTSPDYEQTGICVGQPNHFFRNLGNSRFEDASVEAGPVVTIELPSRTSLAADYDQDGDLDLVVTSNNGPVQLLRNQHRQLGIAGNWLTLRLVGLGKNTHGIGAEVSLNLENSVTGEKLTLRRSLLAGSSYLGGNAPELFFGLGEFDIVAVIEIRWPSGTTTTHGPGKPNTTARLFENRKPR